MILELWKKLSELADSVVIMELLLLVSLPDWLASVPVQYAVSRTKHRYFQVDYDDLDASLVENPVYAENRHGYSQHRVIEE